MTLPTDEIEHSSQDAPAQISRHFDVDSALVAELKLAF
jgi:hypothetical protein